MRKIRIIKYAVIQIVVVASSSCSPKEVADLKNVDWSINFLIFLPSRLPRIGCELKHFSAMFCFNYCFLPVWVLIGETFLPKSMERVVELLP